MALTYRIYFNGGAGGPVNYSTPLASTSGLFYVSAPLGTASDNTFAVRVLDPATNLEEANTEARVRIVLDASGQDISDLPNPPHSLTAIATAAGGCHVTWAYSPSGQGGAPTGFHVYLTPGTTPGYPNPAADVPFVAGQVGYSCDLKGLSDQAIYSLGVRSYNAVATETNTTVIVTVTGDASYPDDVESLSAAVI